jgi:CRP/FNR family cyclic AMP-dependent transcriptional regulator
VSSLGARHDLVSLLDEDPDLAAGLNARERELAERHAIAGAVTLQPPEWDTSGLTCESKRGWLGLFVVEGMLLRRVTIGRRFACELAGPGDLIRPWDTDGDYAPLPISISWRVLAPTRLAVLDARFAARTARWSQITANITGRAAQRARSLALMGALSHLPRAYERLLILFRLLAERWGRVCPDGIRLELPVTHEVLAMLIGTQRPTVTLALRRLGVAGLLLREGRDRWLLTHAAIDSLGTPETLDLPDGPPLALAAAQPIRASR